MSAPAERERLHGAAAEIAAAVAARAVPARGGGATWLREGAGPPAPLGPHLYDGTAGVALFLAAFDHVRGTAEHRALVLGALAPLAATVRALGADPERASALRLPVGGMVGIGSWVYAFARAGAWTGEAALLDAADGAARLLTPARLTAAGALDVVDGCAGAVLALLALHRVRPSAAAGEPSALDRASLAAAPLLRARPAAGGFAHGTSGAACALLRLHALTGAPALRDAAHAALDAERRLFDPRLGNWTDPRTGRPLEQSAWCHGAPGIALARAGGLASEPGLAGELRRCLSLTLALPPAPLDHLCCGAAGRAEILLHAADALADPALRAAGTSLALSIVPAAGPGAYRLRPPGEPATFDPGLLRGVSGIGYALLRAAHPGALPSPLLLE